VEHRARNRQALSYRRWALVVGLAAVLLMLWTGSAWAASATVVRHGPSDQKQIALTFDDNTKSDRGVAILRTL